MQRTVLSAALIGIISLGATAAFADDRAIAARQGYFKLLGANVGVLGAMAKGEVEYDAATAKIHGDNLDALADVQIGHLFVPGTDSVAMPGKTRSLPVIWENTPDLLEKITSFASATEGLGDKVGGGLDGLRQALGPVGQSCTACHDTYRAK